jgi:predicted lipoprotein with Yx(FWY)xxD motif
VGIRRTAAVVLLLAMGLGGLVAPAARATTAGTVITTHPSSLGLILTSKVGRTVYLFTRDTQGASTCYGGCASTWLPVLTHGSPRAAGEAQPALLGTTKRAGGTVQVTYHRHPLYYYAADRSTGQTGGQGRRAFGGRWWVVGSFGNAGTGTTIETGNTSLGVIVTTSAGRTLYLFSSDASGSATCYSACAASWPPLLTVGRPHAAGGANASLLSTTRRQDGNLQITYHGWPLYLYSGDYSAGDTSGEGVYAFGGLWYAIHPDGTPAVGVSLPYYYPPLR